jgi:hypothetical protein
MTRTLLIPAASLALAAALAGAAAGEAPSPAAPAEPNAPAPSLWKTDPNCVYRDPDDDWAKDPSIIKAGDTYYMYYTSANPWQDGGAGGKGEPRIDYATSPDGLAWTRRGVALAKGKPGDWDDTRPQAPAKPVLKDGRYYMYYAAAGKQVHIGYATSTDLVHWTKAPENPVIQSGKANDPFVYVEDGKYYLFYDDAAERVHYVRSDDLVHWSAPTDTGAVGEGNIVLKDGGTYTMLTAVGWSHKGEYYKAWTSRSLTGFTDLGRIGIKAPPWAAGAQGHGDVVKRDGQYWLYFQATADVGRSFRIGLARRPAGAIGREGKEE